MKIGDSIIETLITCYDIRRREAVYISRRKAKEEPAKNYLMRDIAMGTSAAPTYFPPYPLGDQFLIDGGMVANNPASLAYAEAKRLWPDQEVVLLSLGTGSLTRPIQYEKAKGWGLLRWAAHGYRLHV